MKISKVSFARDYEFELPSSVEVPEDFIKRYAGNPEGVLLYVLCKLICEKPNEVLNGLMPNDDIREE